MIIDARRPGIFPRLPPPLVSLPSHTCPSSLPPRESWYPLQPTFPRKNSREWLICVNPYPVLPHEKNQYRPFPEWTFPATASVPVWDMRPPRKLQCLRPPPPPAHLTEATIRARIRADAFPAWDSPRRHGCWICVLPLAPLDAASDIASDSSAGMRTVAERSWGIAFNSLELDLLVYGTHSSHS